MRECPNCSGCVDDTEERCPHDGSALVHTLDGAVLVDGKYRLEKRLSQGGMGVVYLARHLDLHRVFALKLIRSTGGWSEPQLARFRLEAETLGRLKHPGIVDVTDFGIDPRAGGLPYLVMERLEGSTLLERCRSRGHLTIGEALPILAAVGRAVDFAHDQGVLHRDLKPDNVFLSENGEGLVVKLLDFGLARDAHRGVRSGKGIPVFAEADTIAQDYPAGTDISDAPTLEAPPPRPRALEVQTTALTPPGSLAGTPRYMAPECFRSGETSVATDTYALGVTAYFALVGHHPFEGSAQAIMQGHLHGEPPRPSSVQPDLTPLLDAALLAPLAKDPAHRPVSAEAFVSQLAAAAHRAHVREWSQREWPRRAVIAVAVGGLLVALGPVAMRLGVLGDLHRRSVDARLRALGPRPADSRLRFVVLDDASLDGVATPLGSREMADGVAERLEALFAAGARAVAIDMLLPLAWSRSEAFSQLVLRHQGALTLAAHVSASGKVVGPEVLQGLTAVALGPDALRGLFGLVSIEPDGDGVVRRARLGFRGRDGGDQPTWAAHAVKTLLGTSTPPPGPDESFWIDCSADWKHVERVAWKDVALRLEREPSLFSGALVFVGGDISGSGDEGYRVGSGLEVPGVLVQAMTADTILRGFPIREAKVAGAWSRLAEWLGLSSLAFLVLTAGRPWRIVSAGVALALVYAFAAFSSFPYTRTLVPVVSPALQTASALLVCLLLRRNLSPFPTPSKRRSA